MSMINSTSTWDLITINEPQGDGVGTFCNAPASQQMLCMFRIAGYGLTPDQFCQLHFKWPKRGDIILSETSQ